MKVTYPIAKPEEARKKTTNPWDRYKALNKQTEVFSARCKTQPLGQLPNFVRERNGLEVVEEKKLRPWKKNRCRRWEKKLKADAKAKGIEVLDDDPDYRVCEDPPHVKRDDTGKMIPAKGKFQAQAKDAAADASPDKGPAKPAAAPAKTE